MTDEATVSGQPETVRNVQPAAPNLAELKK